MFGTFGCHYLSATNVYIPMYILQCIGFEALHGEVSMVCGNTMFVSLAR